MDNAGDGTFWGSVAAAVAALGAGAWKLMSSQKPAPYNGPERRREMKEVQKELADLRNDLSVLQTKLEAVKETFKDDVIGVKEDIRAFRHMQELFDTRLRRGDRETARELGAMSEAFQKLEYMIAHERGWTKRDGLRSGSTPPNGYGIAPKDDQTPEPGGE